MKKNIIISGIMVFILSFSYLTDSKKVFKKMYALEGIWTMKIKNGFICEEWKIIDKHYLQNRGYLVKGTDTTINERVALTRTKDDIFYTSSVEDQNEKKPVAFKLTSANGHVFIFENPVHDFPRRIVYDLVTPDSLHAYIDDGMEGTKKVQHFYYSKNK